MSRYEGPSEAIIEMAVSSLEESHGPAEKGTHYPAALGLIIFTAGEYRPPEEE